MMRALLLAAGLGTRLKPITNNIPKCLVPIGGKPLLQIWLEKLEKAGVKKFLINTHYLHEQVESFIFKSRFKNSVELYWEKNLKGTAGTLFNNIDFFKNDDGFLIHADNLCEDNILKFIKFHNQRPSYCEITMMVFETDKPFNCGIVNIDKNNVVQKFFEKKKNPPGNLANGAVYILSNKFIKSFKSKFINVSDFSNEVLPNMLNKIFIYKTNNRFIDIGTIDNYNKANNIIEE